MNKKLGAFIVPTGIGASIGGYAGDAGAYARKFAQYTQLIVNPNVVNAGVFSAITDSMLYTEGYTLDSFFRGEINLLPSSNNKIGIIYDKAIDLGKTLEQSELDEYSINILRDNGNNYVNSSKSEYKKTISKYDVNYNQ